MNPLIVMALIAGITALLISVFRSKAAMVFMALCAGSVLTTFASGTVVELLNVFSTNDSDTALAIVKIGLLVVPAFITLLLVSRTMNGPKAMMNIFPAILTGITILFLVVPLLPPGTKYSIVATSLWGQLLQYQAVLVGSAVFICLLQLWGGARGSRHKRGRHSR